MVNKSWKGRGQGEWATSTTGNGVSSVRPNQIRHPVRAKGSGLRWNDKRGPGASVFRQLQEVRTTVFTGVTTSCESIDIENQFCG